MLQLKNIKFYYGNGSLGFKISIDRIQFNDSIITCVLGKNGSGKTTVLNIIGGHLRTKEGNLILFGEEINNKQAELRPTSTVFQQIGLFPHLTVRENIEIAIEPNSFFKKAKATKIKSDNLMADFKLTELENRKPNELSIGQQQRVAIARALSTKPKVLLLDEPTSALDFANINYLKKLLFEIKERRTVPIIIVVSHDLPFVMSIADNIKFIEDGKFIFDGTTNEFQSSKYFVN